MIGIEVRYVPRVRERWAVHRLFGHSHPSIVSRYAYASQVCDEVWQLLNLWCPTPPCRIIMHRPPHATSLLIGEAWIDDALAGVPSVECETLRDTFHTVQRWLQFIDGREE